MATVDGFTAAFMQAIVDATVVGGSVDATTGHLTLTTHAGGTIDGGNLFPNPVELGNAIDLNTIVTTGRYTQAQNAEAAAGTNYPAGIAGMLEVVANTGGTHVWQRYTPYNNNAFSYFYVRVYYNVNGWSVWKKFSSDDQDLLLAWPIGSVYLSVANANPSTLFGGTWVAFGAGKMPIGVATGGDTRWDNAEETGGSETITANNLPTHTHTITGPSGADAAHTHPIGGSSGADAAHTHAIGGSSGSQSANHTHNQSNPLTVLVTNTLTAATGSTDDGGASLAAGKTSSRYYRNIDNTGGGANTSTTENASHTHTMPAATAAGSSHTHTLPANAGAGSSHTHTLPAATGNNTTTAAGFMPPFISVYMWKRTA